MIHTKICENNCLGKTLPSFMLNITMNSKNDIVKPVAILKIFGFQIKNKMYLYFRFYMYGCITILLLSPFYF